MFYKRWKARGDSAADTEKENAVSAPDTSERQLIILGYFAVIRGAVTDKDTSILIEDEDDNVLWSDWFGTAAAIGTRLGIVFGTDSSSGLEVPMDKGAKIVTLDGGTGCIVTSGMWGIEV